MDHEGKQVAEWMNMIGITAFVLKYRLGPKYHHPVMLMDAQRAIRYVRSLAPALKHRRGAASASWASRRAAISRRRRARSSTIRRRPVTRDEIDRRNSRPDFLILGYPVISLTESYAHAGSRTNLLGETPDPALLDAAVERQAGDEEHAADVPVPHG